jgi:hypothetical protein
MVGMGHLTLEWHGLFGLNLQLAASTLANTNSVAHHQLTIRMILRFPNMEVPPNHPVVMDDYDFVLKPMVTRGSPIT